MYDILIVRECVNLEEADLHRMTRHGTSRLMSVRGHFTNDFACKFDLNYFFFSFKSNEILHICCAVVESANYCNNSMIRNRVTVPNAIEFELP